MAIRLSLTTYFSFVLMFISGLMKKVVYRHSLTSTVSVGSLPLTFCCLIQQLRKTKQRISQDLACVPTRVSGLDLKMV